MDTDSSKLVFTIGALTVVSNFFTTESLKLVFNCTSEFPSLHIFTAFHYTQQLSDPQHNANQASLRSKPWSPSNPIFRTAISTAALAMRPLSLLLYDRPCPSNLGMPAKGSACVLLLEGSSPAHFHSTPSALSGPPLLAFLGSKTNLS